jgi:hypothetical protein
MLEMKGYKDKISSNPPIIQKWKELELPELWLNIEEYRKFKQSV